MNPKILSLDIDYFNFWEDCGGEPRDRVKYLSEFLCYIDCFGKKINEIKFIKHHHKILNYFDNYESMDLYNVDFHSDFAENFGGKLCCGTWNRFVMCQEKSNFFWIHPLSKKEEHHGYCTREKVFNNKNLHSWGSVRKREIKHNKVFNYLSKYRFDDIFVVESEDYCDPDLASELRKFMRIKRLEFSNRGQSPKLKEYIKKQRAEYSNE